MTAVVDAGRRSPAWQHVEDLLTAGRCAILDGAVATELPDSSAGPVDLDERLWGTGALVTHPEAVLEVHRQYVDAGCDVISTDTWGLPSALRTDAPAFWDERTPVHWVDVARRGMRLARRAVADAGRERECAVAFSLGPDIDGPDGPDGVETVRILNRLFTEEPPDLVLLETLSLLRPSTYAIVEALVGTGLPVWLSFRRCRHGVCGAHGEHWGGPEGDAFGRAAMRLEQMGIAALLANCVPPRHLDGLVPRLRDFTDLPLGLYPNLGYHTAAGWHSDTRMGPDGYAALAAGWRGEGAQIIGGCCGVGPRHIEATRSAVDEVVPHRTRGSVDAVAARPMADGVNGTAVATPWTDDEGRALYPLQFPSLLCEPDVFVPTQGSFMVWRHLFKWGVGRGARCLDIGCGTGLLSVQLALNGAEHVHAIDRDRAAVDNTLVNAYRNGVADRVSGASVDLYPWIPDERYDVIVASLYQMPVDPFEQSTTHRPLDYWGRNLVDHLLATLPRALAPGGHAYVMQLSILSQRRTAALLAETGLTCQVADFGFFGFHELFRQRAEQIRRVEQASDAYHLTLGDQDVMVAYLLDISHAEAVGVT